VVSVDSWPDKGDYDMAVIKQFFKDLWNTSKRAMVQRIKSNDEQKSQHRDANSCAYWCAAVTQKIIERRM